MLMQPVTESQIQSLQAKLIVQLEKLENAHAGHKQSALAKIAFLNKKLAILRAEVVS